jgi:serine phosphatase RsbU (regulator of sigma subunit)
MARRVVTGEVDYAALFAATPTPCVVLDPESVIVGVNRAYCEVAGRSRDELVGRVVFDVLPGGGGGGRSLGASLERVRATGSADAMMVQRCDVPVPGRPGVVEERWWAPVNTPVPGGGGELRWIIHQVEDVTASVLARRGDAGAVKAQAELYARAQELEHLNEELRRAHARERQVAMALQEAMLHTPDLARHHDVAVRYLPAVGSLNVCGDWYDAVDLPDGRFTVAVGDVVGHGLGAATVMGMLRSALSAASRAVASPAQALEVLGLYARSVDGALAATAVTALIDTRSRLIIYSSAGHPPPVLMRPDGSCLLLDQATDPPLGARPEHVPRPQAGTAYGRGDMLVLYTDGLIERRGEDIDTGLDRLTGALAQNAGLAPDPLADALLDHMGLGRGGQDDIALVIVRL